MKIDISRSDIHQQRAICEMDSRRIVVGASAGAGKTRVLVTRILRLCLEERIPLQRITALTFTEAAAQEMKNRLAEDLYKLRSETADPEETAWIDAQISSLVRANITTIDSWCLTILKKYAASVGLDPACTRHILSSSQDEMILRNAYDACLQEAAEADEEKTVRLLEYFSPRSEDYDSLYKAIRKLIQTAESLSDPKAWYAKAKTMYRPFTALKQLDPDVVRAFLDCFSVRCSQLRDNCFACIGKLEDAGEKKLKKEHLIAVVNIATDCMRLLEEGDYDGYTAKLEDLAACKVPAPSDKIIIDPLRKKITEAVKDLIQDSYPEKTLCANSALQAEICASLCDLAQHTAETARQMRRDAVSMNFADMERYALEILQSERGSAAAELNASVDEILVDEFQDTSVLQDTIIRIIAGDKRIFRVGDVKQSIYRFRQAKPQLMRDLLSDPEAAALSLRYNYRSRENIILFTNLLFSRLMNTEGLKDTYTEEDTVSAGVPDQKRSPEIPGATLVLLKDPDPRQTKDGKQKRMEAALAKNIKAGWIAQKIRKMMDEDASLQFRDFAVLSRSHSEQIVLKKQFDRYGIPFDIDAREGFYQSDLCRNMLALMKIILDPSDALSWLTVLTSPLCRCSDEQIASMVLRHGSIVQAAQKECPRLCADLERWRTMEQSASVAEILSDIADTPIEHEGFEVPFFDAMNPSDQANFDALFERTLTSGYTHLYELAAEIELGMDEKSSEALTAGKDEDTVTATTIHHSKGLQYKYVFLWGTGENKDMDNGSQVLVNDELTVGFKDIDLRCRIALPSVQQTAIAHRNTMEDLEEFSRLLYVAVTRAVERLWIVDEEMAVHERCACTVGFLQERPGITGLITGLLDHEPGMNENGLFEVTEEYYADTAALYHKAADDAFRPLPRFEMDFPAIPQMRTPSSFEAQPSGSALPPLTGTASGTAYGTRLHALAELLPDDAEWTEEMILTADPELPPKAVQSLLAFARSDLYAKAKTMELHKEYPFYYEDSEMRMNGTMDFVAVGKQEIILIDFKTDAKPVQKIRSIYTPQLHAYAKALAHFYPGLPVHAYAWSFHHDCAIEIKGT